MALPTEIVAKVFSYLELPLLVEIGASSFRLLDRPSRTSCFIRSTPGEIEALFNIRPLGPVLADLCLQYHTNHPNGKLIKYHPVSPFLGHAWSALLDLCVENGFSNHRLLSLLHRGLTGYHPLLAAARTGRFYTMRALFYNDWFGDCDLQMSVIMEIIRQDNRGALKWIFRKKVIASYRRPYDLFVLFKNCLQHDSVSCFAFLHNEVARACCKAIIKTALRLGARRCIHWILMECCAIDWNHFQKLRLSVAKCYRRFGASKNEIGRDSVRQLRQYKDILLRNQDVIMCGERYVVPHLDYYTYGVEVSAVLMR